MHLLPYKTPSEAKVVTFDFSNEAASGATLSSPIISSTLVEGVNTTPLSLGTPSVVGLTVMVLASAGTDGCRYSLKCQVQSSNGEIHENAAQLAVSTGAL